MITGQEVSASLALNAIDPKEQPYCDPLSTVNAGAGLPSAQTPREDPEAPGRHRALSNAFCSALFSSVGHTAAMVFCAVLSMGNSGR